MSNDILEIFKSHNLELRSFAPEGLKRVKTAKHGALTVKAFCARLQKAMGDSLFSHAVLTKCVFNPDEMSGLLSDLLPAEEDKTLYIPEAIAHLKLFLDLSSNSREKRFFCVDSENNISKVSGMNYLGMSGLKDADAFSIATPVYPEYLPRSPKGVVKGSSPSCDSFNTYVRPSWVDYLEKNKVPDKLPTLFKKLIYHLFVSQEEIDYFFAWLYVSLTSRSYVYLVLCGIPGVGKNRLNLVLKALHGMANSVDGKQSTLNDKFNSQLVESTLVWFDEIKYTEASEGMMKGLQNDYVSIEKKGVDASRSTPIYCSMVISNNKPKENYIPFDARKFAPLQMRNERLEVSMASDEIDELTKKVADETKPEYDVAFVAQIAQWILKHGKSDRWPNLEYKGPMFYRLAHTSMKVWQRRAVEIFQHPDLKPNVRNLVFDADKGYLWSRLEAFSRRKLEKSKEFKFTVDSSNVKSFYDSFLDLKGRKGFVTTEIPESIMGDFWVKCILPDIIVASESGETKGESENGSATTAAEKKTGPTAEDDLDLI
jgi:hypothetical protein